MKKKVVLFFMLSACLGFSSKVRMLKPYKTVHLGMNEPSEICSGSKDDTFFILADKAFLFETSSEGKIIRKSDVKAYDIEGACTADDKLYVSDESMRQVYVFDKLTLKLLQVKQLQFNGARNLAFESVTFNPLNKHFLLATEKAPQLFFEYDQDFINVNQFSIKGINEVSSLTWNNGSLYVLSDEQETIFKVDPSGYTVKAAWKIPVINPEGICFDKEGNIVVVSDDMGKMFYFKNPEL